MRPRFTIFSALLAGLLMLGTAHASIPAQATGHVAATSRTADVSGSSPLCNKVRIWSGHGCTAANTRAYWRSLVVRNAPQVSRSRSTADIPAVLRRIRGCESGTGPGSDGNYRAQNPSSDASGAYQFLGSTWTAMTGLRAPASAYSVQEQDHAALVQYNLSGTSAWAASRSCWE